MRHRSPIYGEGESIEDVREIRDDQTLREAVDLKTILSSSAIGGWLKQMGSRGDIHGMAQVNETIA